MSEISTLKLQLTSSAAFRADGLILLSAASEWRPWAQRQDQTRGCAALVAGKPSLVNLAKSSGGAVECVCRGDDTIN